MTRIPAPRLVAAAALAAALAACSSETPSEAPEAAETPAAAAAGEPGAAVDLAAVVKEREENFEAIGKAFKAVRGAADGFKTEALPAIWEKPEAFKAAATKLVDESAKLASLAPGGDKAAVGAQAMAMGGACKGCHDQFRKDDKK